jgi:DNA-binding transcriptional LysR family regulator
MDARLDNEVCIDSGGELTKATDMEIRQLRYFAQVVQSGSMGRAAIELNLVTSALSQQVSRLESELCMRLLERTKNGVQPTSAGLAFWQKAQLILRITDDAAKAAQICCPAEIGFCRQHADPESNLERFIRERDHALGATNFGSVRKF